VLDYHGFVPNLFARHLRANQTDAEKRLWRVLRDFKARGFHFRRQVPIGAYVADFATMGAKLIVELDGGQHGEAAAKVNDAARTVFLNDQGFRVLRFWNDQVFADVDEVARVIFEALKSRAPFQFAVGTNDSLQPRGVKSPRSRANRKLPSRRRDPHP